MRNEGNGRMSKRIGRGIVVAALAVAALLVGTVIVLTVTPPMHST
jgi:hypothetical protein